MDSPECNPYSLCQLDRLSKTTNFVFVGCLAIWWVCGQRWSSGTSFWNHHYKKQFQKLQWNRFPGHPLKISDLWCWNVQHCSMIATNSGFRLARSNENASRPIYWFVCEVFFEFPAATSSLRNFCNPRDWKASSWGILTQTLCSRHKLLSSSAATLLSSS